VLGLVQIEAASETSPKPDALLPPLAAVAAPDLTTSTLMCHDYFRRIGNRCQGRGDGRYPSFGGDAHAANVWHMVRLLMKSPLRARLVQLRSVIAISLSMLVMSAAVWGAVYLLNSALLR
jgi:hypothetical protein